MDFLIVSLCLILLLIIITSATIKSKEAFESIPEGVGLASTNLVTPGANQALREAENDTCIPILTAAQTIPNIMDQMPVKLNTLKTFNNSPNHCFMYKPTPDFVCSKENPALWDKSLGDSFRDTVKDIRETEVAEQNKFASQPGCLIQFDPYLRPEETYNYVQYLGSRNQFVKDKNAQLSQLANRNNSLSSQVNSLSANVGSLETKLSYEAAQNQGKTAAIKNLHSTVSSMTDKMARDTQLINEQPIEMLAFDPQENAIKADARGKCLATYGLTSIELQNCAPSSAEQQWSYDEALHLRNKNTNKCMSGANSMVTYKPCNDMASQQWMYDSKKRLRYLLDPSKCIDYQTVPMKMNDCGKSAFQTFQVMP